MKLPPILVSATTMITLCFGQVKPENPVLSSLVEAERLFAHTSLEIGARAAFMKFFADDAVVFRPTPVKYKEAMKNVPLPLKPLETTLEWEPVYADVAASGDMGYTTGPAVWTDHSPAKRPTYYGYYFSVWKRQSAGEWKVVFDVGTEQPGPHTGSRTLLASSASERKRALTTLPPGEHVASLMKAEREFLGAVQKVGAIKAITRYAGKEARVYREREVPVVGPDSLRAFFSRMPYLANWNPLVGDVARSGELGYVYGAYETKTSARVDSGYYVRVWKRDEENMWKFVAEVASPPLPPAPPPKQ
jgi:ketosteroid isomerase-like protein